MSKNVVFWQHEVFIIFKKAQKDNFIGLKSLWNFRIFLESANPSLKKTLDRPWFEQEYWIKLHEFARGYGVLISKQKCSIFLMLKRNTTENFFSKIFEIEVSVEKV